METLFRNRNLFYVVRSRKLSLFLVPLCLRRVLINIYSTYYWHVPLYMLKSWPGPLSFFPLPVDEFISGVVPGVAHDLCLFAVERGISNNAKMFFKLFFTFDLELGGKHHVGTGIWYFHCEISNNFLYQSFIKCSMIILKWKFTPQW